MFLALQSVSLLVVLWISVVPLLLPGRSSVLLPGLGPQLATKLSDTLDIQPSPISTALQVVPNKHVLEPQVLDPLFDV